MEFFYPLTSVYRPSWFPDPRKPSLIATLPVETGGSFVATFSLSGTISTLPTLSGSFVGTLTLSATISVVPILRPPGSVTLAWDPVATATGYKFYVGTQSGVYNYPGSPFDVGNVTQYTFIAPNSGNYCFAVTAYNQYGESGFSNEYCEYIVVPGALPQPALGQKLFLIFET